MLPRQNNAKVLTATAAPALAPASFSPSLPRWQRVHLHPAHPWRRPANVRASLGTMESRPERGEGASQRHFYARWYVFPSRFVTQWPSCLAARLQYIPTTCNANTTHVRYR